jgi:hypothetical protein
MTKTYPFWKIATPRRMMLGYCVHEIKVTHLGKGIYGCRVFTDGVLNAENRCKGKENIRLACRDLLRWESKLGNISAFAQSSRHRQ